MTFDEIVTNGRSFGALTVEYEAATYHDVDGLIVSGFGHDLAVTQPDDPVVADTIPASADPAFAAERSSRIPAMSVPVLWALGVNDNPWRCTVCDSRSLEPLHEQQCGVVTQAGALMMDHRADQAAGQFLERLTAGGFPLGQVGQTLQPEQLPAGGAGLDHPVGVQEHRITAFQVMGPGLGDSPAEAERQGRLAVQLGDHLPAAQ